MPRPGPGFEKTPVAPVVTEGPPVRSVAVIGAGVSGLAAAYRLKKEGLSVTVFEGEDAPGGKIQSYSKEGFIWERGANTMTENEPVVAQLIDDLNLQDLRLFPNQQKKRYVVRDGQPHLIPSNPLGLLTTPLLSPGAKLRMLAEPLMWRRRSASSGREEEDESLGSFLERHIGREPVDYLADPFCSGTAGSSPDALSVRHSFPALHALEKAHGSLLVGAAVTNAAKLFSSKLGGSKGTAATQPPQRRLVRGSFSFLGGMQTLPNALAERVGKDRLRLGAPVRGLTLQQEANSKQPRWTVSTGSKGKDGEQFDAVVFTAPMRSLADIHISKGGAAYPLELTPPVYQPMTMVINAFNAEDVKRALPGFGVLIPSKESSRGLQSTGTLFSSSMFWDRAPPGQVLFTTFVGGARNPKLAAQPPEVLQAVVMKDLQQLLGVQGPPTFSRQVKWAEAFPEYGKGYDAVLATLSRVEKEFPGFYYAGNHRGGLAVGTAMASGFHTAGKVAEDLQKQNMPKKKCCCKK